MIKCIAIDDEPLALDLVEDFVAKVPFLSLEKSFSNALDALPLLNSEKIDLIFLDIQMPQITGLQFIKSLEQPPKVVFTTAYAQHAVEGFNVDAVDYLLKPFTFERFLKAANKAQQALTSEQQSTASGEDYIFVKSGYDMVKVRFADIQYIEGLKDYVKIHTTQKTIIALLTMKSLESSLPTGFLRVHRSYIINFDHLESVGRRNLIVAKHDIPLGDMYREQFMAKLNRN
ncbi:LytR/AlgR family response regulator transcription factor [Tunicatimonas pelagia]|uniref:LytR/AlgR family response regulator transcription factor n=1 Tax=Tunicatimonas pelagia TaxID=931531 RepID=UPI002666E813|nr:LytTR family DNA-binding domain-containing protein [Tunicatimonas pelagia]WKN42820.1 LytTR family DNA-binding domain-containing protein [Tunicatimonas pelagia]